MSDLKEKPLAEAALLRDFEGYRQLVDEWTEEFGLARFDLSGSAQTDIDYVSEPVISYEVHGT